MKNVNLRNARKEKHLSQKELADLIGVSRQTIILIEKGDCNPTLNICIELCKALNKSLDELFWQ